MERAAPGERIAKRKEGTPSVPPARTFRRKRYPRNLIRDPEQYQALVRGEVGQKGTTLIPLPARWLMVAPPQAYHRAGSAYRTARLLGHRWRAAHSSACWRRRTVSVAVDCRIGRGFAPFAATGVLERGEGEGEDRPARPKAGSIEMVLDRALRAAGDEIAFRCRRPSRTRTGSAACRRPGRGEYCDHTRRECECSGFN